MSITVRTSTQQITVNPTTSAVTVVLAGPQGPAGADGAAGAAGDITAAGTATLTNKTLDSFTNTVQADDLHVQVRNSSGATITKGTPVYVSGYNVGQELVEVAPTDASDPATMSCMGIADSDIANNATNGVVRSGRLSGVDTSGFTVGNALYVSETAGALTATIPTAPAIVQQVATVLRVHASLGVLDVDVRGKQVAASETDVGVVELATSAEAITGTDPLRVITPATLRAVLVSHGLIA